jgi:uncharacterized Zn finger protein
MAQFSRTWWGQRFIAALEQFTDSNRLGRGRSYASNGKIKSYEVTNGKVEARVRGSINPYFGVYTEPLYKTSIKIESISPADWQKLITSIGSRADLITRLLLGEIPDNIEEVTAPLGLHLLPHNQKDFTTDCSCPDYSNPCKHIAGVYYLLAAELDRDPFLMFELRGLSRGELRTQLANTSLGQILADALTSTEVPLIPVDSYFPRPQRQNASSVSEASSGHKAFWTGAHRLPSPQAGVAQASVPALLIKKQGDYPAFWPKDTSFLGVMEDLYERVRNKSKQMR